MPTFTIQTRALIKDKNDIIDKIEKDNFKLTEKLSINDKYYADLKSDPTGLDLYEKIGKDLRIRIINEDTLKVEQHLDTLKKDNVTNHDIFEYSVLFQGKPKDFDKALEIASQNMHPDFLIEIKKERTIYSKGNTIVNIDLIEGKTTIIEIDNKITDSKDYLNIKQNQLDLLSKLDVNKSDIFIDNYTRQRINSHLKNDPVLRKILLEKELEELIKSRKAKELLSNEAYTDAGDGWHENPTYEAMVNDIMVMNNRIIEIKRELGILTNH